MNIPLSLRQILRSLNIWHGFSSFSYQLVHLLLQSLIIFLKANITGFSWCFIESNQGWVRFWSRMQRIMIITIVCLHLCLSRSTVRNAEPSSARLWGAPERGEKPLFGGRIALRRPVPGRIHRIVPLRSTHARPERQQRQTHWHAPTKSTAHTLPFPNA